MLKRSRLRGLVMFLIACFTSPCCTPVIVPVLLALLSGTPVAVWMSQYLGWVYGALTFISVVSFVLALRWMGKRKASSQRATSRPLDISALLPVGGDKAHVE